MPIMRRPQAWTGSGVNPNTPASGRQRTIYRSQIMRGAGYESGILGQVPNDGPLAPSMDQDVTPH
eukprot:839316-Pyramimonas_sp.AAC.1